MGKLSQSVVNAPRVVLYLRVSTGEQVESGAGLAAQESHLRAEAERRGWRIVAVLTDAGASGKSMLKRPALAEALALLDSKSADTLAVSKLDRLSRSLLDFAGLMARAQRDRWNLVALDLGIDLSTPAGEFMASVMASAAQWERRLIGQRTRDALAEKRAQGVVLGRPAVLSSDVVRRIVDEQRAGRSLRLIAAGLTADQVPTARGGAVWSSSSVQAVLRSQQAAALKRIPA